jgi:hypothetical protein
MPVIYINNDDIRLNSSTSDKVVVAGSLGIGTTAPDVNLHVAGAVNTSPIIKVESVSNGYSARFVMKTPSREWRIGTFSGQNDNFWIYDLNTNAYRFVIDTSGNVGIGTTSPAIKLHVVSNIEEVIRVESGATGAIHFFNGATRTGILGYSNGTTIASGADADDMVLRAESGHKLHLAISGIPRFTLDSAGNVGIGTTSPVEKLDVAGTARMDIGITEGIHYAGTGLQHWGDGGTGIDFPANDTVDILTSSSTRIRVNSSGNVGIGTTSPTQKLEVNGVIESYYLEFKPVVFYDFNSDTTGDWVKLNSTLSVPNDSVTRYTSTGVDSNISKSFNFDGGQNPIIRIRYKVVTGSPGSGEIFYGNSQHGYSASYFKVFTLVSDGGWHTLVLDMSNLTSGGTDWIDYNVTSIRFDLTNVSGVVIDIDWISIGGNGYGTQYFENDVAFMDGNVGIGTTAPQTPLHVNVSGAADVIKFTRDTGTNGALSLDFSGANSNFVSEQGGFTFSGSSSSYGVNFTAAGNVGIGTTSPGYKLDVSGSTRVTDTLFVNTTLNKGKFNIIGYDNGGINIIDQRTSSSGIFYSSITFRD